MALDDLPFPSDVEVMADEAARFRASVPEERMRAIRSALAAGCGMPESRESLAGDQGGLPERPTC